MSEENNVVDTTKTTETSEKVIDWEARAKKAEAKIQDIKNSETPKGEVKEETPVTETPIVKPEDMEKFYEERKFFENNPDLVEHKEKLKEYNEKGLSWDKARKLVEDDDPTIANRKVAKQINFTSWEVPSDATVTNKQLEDMSQEEYTKARDLMKAGKLKLTN